MPNKNVWIEIARDWIEVAVVSRGRHRSVHRVLVDPGDTRRADQGEDASPAPANLRHTIAHALSLLNVPRASVHAVWHAGGSWTDVHTIGVPRNAASEAATLAFCAANALDQDAWTTSALVIDSARAETPSSNVLVSALRNDVLAEIECAVTEAGCTLKGMIPAQSIALAQVARDAIDASRRAGVLVVSIHAGEESTGIAIARDGTLMLARSLELGFSMLREAYIRAIPNAHDDYGAAFIAASKRLFQGEGVPSPKSRAEDAMAVFQTARPFLQRLFIEIKQTIRFTIDEDELDGATVRLTGPGAAIPHLDSLLREEVGFNEVDRIAPHDSPLEPGHGIACSLGCDAGAMAIRPPGLVEHHERSCRRAALLYGAVGAALLLAADTWYVSDRAGVLDAQIDALSAQIDEWNERAQSGFGVGPQVLASGLETLIQADSGQRADWGVALAEIAGCRPTDVWLTSVSGERDEHASFLTLEAVTEPADPEADPHDRIARFVELLQASDLVSEALLGSTEQLSRDNERRLRFSLRLELHESAAPWMTAEVTP